MDIIICYEMDATEARNGVALGAPSCYIFGTDNVPIAHVITFSSITKTFGGTTALDCVSFTLERGKVHALMGENGAGKSTLGRILAGILQPDSGTVLIDTRACRFTSPRDARRAGVGMVHQELALCPDLTVAENLCLGDYPSRFGFVCDPAAMGTRARTMLGDVGSSIDPRMMVRDLPLALRQVVQIAGAVGTGADILVFDEPTSALSDAEAERLFTLIHRLRDRGVTVIYVSHRMAEVFALADTITVLRDGRFIGSLERSDVNEDKVVTMMIGRELGAYFPRHAYQEPGEPVLEVEGLSSPGHFQDIGFRVRAGEILGIAGLVGAGRSEVAAAIMGLDDAATGDVRLDGRSLAGTSTRRRIALGLGLVPEDRKQQGLAPVLSCRMNHSFTLLPALRRFLLLDRARETAMLERSFRELAIKAPGYETPVEHLSGGNQQKIVLARWLGGGARVLIFDEPTRGVDIGAKTALHGVIEDLAHAGMGIILITSELPELLHLATRILVMRGGHIVGEITKEHATQDQLLRMMSGLAA
jgi:ABC-type sugar transport system ATPase subunit